MKIHKHSIAVRLCFVLSIWPTLAFGAREGRLIGKVIGPDGKPIAGVRVSATSPEVEGFSQTDTTNDRGVFKVDFERIDALYRYEFEKVGYVTLKIEQRWTIRGTERLEFTLYPAEVPAVGEMAPALAAVANPAITAYNAGATAFNARDYGTARAKFEEATQHDPSLRQAWVALAKIHLEQQRYRESADAAEKAVAQGATDEALLKARWEAYRRLGDEAKADQARADLDKFGRLAEEARRIHNEGVIMTKLGNHQEAFAKFEEALELDPNFEPALLGLATSALQTDRAKAAFEAAAKLLKGDPQHAEALKLRYNAALKLKDETQLTEALDGLAAIDPATAREGLFVLATGAFERDEAVKARERFQRVLQIAPDHARSHYFLGLLMMREGKKAEARSHLERFLQLAPSDPDAGTAQDALPYLK